MFLNERLLLVLLIFEYTYLKIRCHAGLGKDNKCTRHGAFSEKGVIYLRKLYNYLANSETISFLHM
jgi:hypothetical protein